jgi:DNA-binding XRE family transcriptional regulator
MNLPLKISIIKSKKRQTFLAHEVGIPEPYMSKIVNGWHNPSPDLKRRIADALGVKVSDIFSTVQISDTSRLNDE